MKEWMRGALDPKGRKKSRICGIVFTALFICTLVCSVVFACVLPRADKIKEIDDTKFTSVFSASDDEWFYTTEKNVVRLNSDNEVVETLPLVENANEGDLSVGKIKDTYATPDGAYMWITASMEGDENKGYLFKLSDENGELVVEETVVYEGQYVRMVEADGYLYLLVKPDAYTHVVKYDAENISAGVVGQGVLYEAWEENEETAYLVGIKDLIILSVDVVDDYLYVLHSGGIFKMSTDFAYNDYRFRYAEKKAEVYAESYDEAYGATYAEKRAEAEAALKEGETLDEEALLAVVEQATKNKLNAAICEELGFISYDENSDKVALPYDDFDESRYGYYIGDKFCGAAYVEEHGKYYVVTTDTNLYAYDVAGLDGMPLHVYWEGETVEGVTLAAVPENTYAALSYNEYTNKGYVIYDAGSQISCIDFGETVSLEWTIEAEFDINRIIQIGGNLYYFYYNRFETERAGQTVLAVVDIEERLQYPTILTLLIISIVLCVLTFICSLIFMLCWKKEGYLERAQKLLKRISRNRWVYITMIPSLILLFSFCYYPAIDSIRLSFFEYSEANPTMRWNNFENYKLVFTDPYTGEMFANMFLYLVSDIFTGIVPPLIFAFFLTVMRNRGYSALVRTLLFLPGVIPGIAGMLIWREGIFSNSGGVLHMLLGLFSDNPHPFLESPYTTRFELLLIGFPYVGAYLIFYGGMMNISESYYEAAELEGIGIWKRFIAIDIPLIMPQVKYIFITTFIHSVQNFARVDSVTQGLQGTMTPIQMIYKKIYGSEGKYGEASAYATIIFVFLFFATIINLRKKKKEFEV